MTPAIAISPLTNNSQPQESRYDFARTIRMTREELRAQLFHDIAQAFEDAFDALEVRP